MKIGLVVEGHGDVSAVPVLIHNILHHLGIYNVEIAPAIRAGEANFMLRNEKFLRFVQLLLNDDEIDAILITCDLEDQCPVEFRQQLLDRLGYNLYDVDKPISIVAFTREFESLFLSQIDIIANKSDAISCDEQKADHAKSVCHSVRNAKGMFSDLMLDLSYKEVRDQQNFAALLSPDSLSERHRSGRRIVDALTRLVLGVGDPLPSP